MTDYEWPAGRSIGLAGPTPMARFVISSGSSCLRVSYRVFMCLLFRSTLFRLPKFIANSAASTDSSQGVGQHTRTHHHTTESFEVFALTSKVSQLLRSWPKVLFFAQAQTDQPIWVHGAPGEDGALFVKQLLLVSQKKHFFS